MAMTTPAMAPLEIELDGEEVADAEAEVELEAVDEDEEVRLEEWPVDCVIEEVVAVAAINLRGSKM